MHGVPVSGWLSTPFTFTLAIDNPALDGLPDGVHDLSLDVQGAERANFKPRPVYLHLARGRAVSPLVPIIGRDMQYGDYGADWGPGVVYVDHADRRCAAIRSTRLSRRGMRSPIMADLYQEELAPHTEQFLGVQMWWEHPAGPQAGGKFTRALVPKWDEDHRGLRVTWRQERFPFRDGPRGSSVDEHLRDRARSIRPAGLRFAEAGGPVRYMKPDGEVITVAGWRVKPGKDPIWLGHPVNVVRQNMELRGTWLSGQYSDNSGFRTPLDVAIDPTNERIWYVAGYEDQCIWKIEILDSTSTTSASASLPAVRVTRPVCRRRRHGGTVQRAGVAGLRPGAGRALCRRPGQRCDSPHHPRRRRDDAGGTPGMGARLLAAGVTPPTSSRTGPQSRRQPVCRHGGGSGRRHATGHLPAADRARRQRAGSSCSTSASAASARSIR